MPMLYNAPIFYKLDCIPEANLSDGGRRELAKYCRSTMLDVTYEGEGGG